MVRACAYSINGSFSLARLLFALYRSPPADARKILPLRAPAKMSNCPLATPARQGTASTPTSSWCRSTGSPVCRSGRRVSRSARQRRPGRGYRWRPVPNSWSPWRATQGRRPRRRSQRPIRRPRPWPASFRASTAETQIRRANSPRGVSITRRRGLCHRSPVLWKQGVDN